ncbi:T9SS type A sorting domain-containing protein [Chryseobacterium sp. Tr-659]|uniref:T9SS type A sorting domain-containing protein n=1 Tax=Chryseobacterium sp. Tr-659 TaxID=2608340 RepID=UPI00141FB60B|nr:T9SS type A sorting domain-containing protein [Chryseobacterium sp. Tr-659]NIF07810.1 T9SS type A sorting domain-containing protein [Chryseobacterium sp. Tr-659]
MKKNHFIYIVCAFLCFYGKAQIALAKEDGTPINNGQVITFNTTNEVPANLHYKIKNISSSPVNVRIKVVSIVNATGSDFQFCYQTTCLPFVSANGIYPANTKPAINIGANSEVSNGYTMWNLDAGSGAFPIDYVIKYYTVDSFNSEYGTPVTFTYRYDPNAVLTVADVKKEKNLFVEIPTTIVQNNIQIASKEDVSYVLYNMEGRRIIKGELKKGKQVIDISGLNSGTYMVVVNNKQNEIISKKIIKSD